MTILGVFLIIYGLWSSYDYLKGFKKQTDLDFMDYFLSELKQSYGLQIVVGIIGAYLLGVLILIGYFNN
jgi:hypothetical protein